MIKKSFLERYRSNLTNREVNYLINFKWQSSNIRSTVLSSKFANEELIQELIAFKNEDYNEVFQPDDLKEKQIISGSECPIQRLSYFIEIC